MVLENVKEMWTEFPRNSSGKKGRGVNKDRFISKMYVPMLLLAPASSADALSLQVPERRFGHYGHSHLSDLSITSRCDDFKMRPPPGAVEPPQRMCIPLLGHKSIYQKEGHKREMALPRRGLGFSGGNATNGTTTFHEAVEFNTRLSA